MSDAELGGRLAAQVIRGDRDECWLWQARTDDFGYGLLKVNGRYKKAHRLAWELEHGPIPLGMCVLHTCDCPPCCNPAHLWLGDRGANNADMVAKGRAHYLRGEEHGSARLTATEVAEIRARYAAGGVTQPELGDAFGISRQLVGAIVRRELWKSVA